MTKRISSPPVAALSSRGDSIIPHYQAEGPGIGGLTHTHNAGGPIQGGQLSKVV
jgi:hypothetical protein